MNHYWGVIVPMAEAAGIDPWLCVKYNAPIYLENHPDFSGFPDYYTFALTVLDKRPVFVGDKLWNNSNGRWDEIEGNGKYNMKLYTWTPPTKKRTFMLGDKELPCPVDAKDGTCLVVGNKIFYFKTWEEGVLVNQALIELLTTARDKD